jgi:hypothetical protein
MRKRTKDDENSSENRTKMQETAKRMREKSSCKAQEKEMRFFKPVGHAFECVV